MGPTRKSRSVNKRFSYINEISPSKAGEKVDKKTQRKRKLADMLGPPWSKDELERFYEAYRKHGKDWKKVSGVVRNRSVDMVEAVYTMNRAYLSLPEGTASVVGLIAMMTDHYSNLAATDSEQESNDGAGTSRKSQKRVQGKGQPNISKASEGRSLPHSQAATSTYGYLSLLKKKRSVGTGPRAVGKRTPRIPVSHSYENVNRDNYFIPSWQGRRLKGDGDGDGDEDQIAREIAKTLAGGSQRGGSPPISRTPNRRTVPVISPPVHNSERMRYDVDEDDLEGSVEADNGDLSRDKSHLVETGGAGTSFQRVRRPYGKKLKADDGGNIHLDDTREACSGTEEGQKIGEGKGKLNIEATDSKVWKSPSQGPRKRSKKVLFRRDEIAFCDALQTLADVSLMMPASKNETEPSVQVKGDEDVDESGLLEAMYANRITKKSKLLSGAKLKGNHPLSRTEVSTVQISTPEKLPVLDDGAIPEGKLESHQSVTKVPRKKQKFVASKISKAETHSDTHLSASEGVEIKDTGRKFIIKSKRISQSASPQLVKHLERSSSSTDPRKEGSDSALSTLEVPVANHPILPKKVRSRRKNDLEKPQRLKDKMVSDTVVRDQSNAPFSSINDRGIELKEKLSNCLSNKRLRRWSTFEWFYSAIDYPWFAKREFVEYLCHVGLGHVPRLTRVEWGVIRSSLGKPRRFSEQFLKEEKEKLNQYRDSVRTHYTELRSGIREGLPADLAKPLSVGQRVVSIHPRTRDIHDGSVLTVDHDRCRVQFDRPELGVEFVMDIDCMPLNPLENMPTSLARNVSVDKFFENLNELKMNGQAKEQGVQGYTKFSPGKIPENVNSSSRLSPPTYPICNLIKHSKVAPTNADSQDEIGLKEVAANQQMTYSQRSSLAQLQAKEADVQALAELTRALDKKEAVVFELRRMHDDVMLNQKDDGPALKDMELFKKQYAAVLVLLQEANEQVSSALYSLRERNTYQGNLSGSGPRPMALGDFGSLSNSSNHSASNMKESGSHINEIVEGSRTKARKMVDAAIQAMSSLKEEGNTGWTQGEAIDYVNDRLPFDDSCMAAVKDPIRGIFASQEKLTSKPFISLPASDSKLKDVSNLNGEPLPTELISHCLATILMIQKCTERQFPPADVALVLDTAVTSLQPCSSRNIPLYTEIQKCMGIIRNQIMALVPT